MDFAAPGDPSTLPLTRPDAEQRRLTLASEALRTPVPPGAMSTPNICAPPAPRRTEGDGSASLANLLAVVRDGASTSGDAAPREQALEELLTALHTPVLNFARRRLERARDAGDEAADVAQDVLVRLAGGAARCRAVTDAQVLAWALTTTRHVLTDRWRSSGRGEVRLVPATEVGTGCERMAEEEWMALAQSFEESAGGLPERRPAYEALLRVAAQACDTRPATACRRSSGPESSRG